MGQSTDRGTTIPAATEPGGVDAVRVPSRGAGVARVELTPKEADVLRLLPTYLTIDGIGRQLGMQRSTAKTHVANLYRKLGVVSRAEAVERAHEARLISRPRAVKPRGRSLHLDQRRVNRPSR